ncbi:sigma-70 family RNA polymerase sigma factor [Demequina litorisediminis]|uniref:RNA polymerase sigma factor n=1 Tax=Demequina litorisediminis TaxID=1849022 RepID=A0ABQ6IGV9_9MICO|nr:sigma-70 family RNA polymerase sigma factor [Demequina litorisediminis]GMA36971.1 RNA polymerase sigma factor SigK [Demequina litorisediminis]
MTRDEEDGMERHLRAVPAPAAAPAATGDAAAMSALLERTALGDTAAYEELYDLVAGAVFGLALRIVRDRDMAEDVAQEALVEVWRRAARYDRSAGTARAWILTIAHRRAVDRVRSEQAHSTRLQAHGAPAEVDHEGPEDVIEEMHGEWQAARVRAGLATLTERQREALDLCFYKGFTHREAAQALGIPLGTAKARIRDALIKLRDGWGGER